MHAAGFTNTVALCGVAFTAGHLRLLAGYTQRIVLLLDADRAGEASMEKIVAMLSCGTDPEGERLEPACLFEVSRMQLPYGEDPDSLLHGSGFVSFRRQITASLHLALLETYEHRLLRQIAKTVSDLSLCLSCEDRISLLSLLAKQKSRLPMVTDKDLSMCFLPLTHIFEKAWSYYCLHKGVTIAINQDPKMIQKTLPEVHPTLMCNVPRFWEKVYAGVHEKINSSSSTMKKIFLDAIETGRKYNLEYKNKSIPAPFGLKLKFEMYNKTVFNLLKRVLGIERGRFFPVAGAPLSDTVNEFLQSVNIPIVYGYGLSETTATVCFYPEIGFQFGSIGEVMPDVQVRIDPENSEILVKGKTVMSGYYNKPAENEKAFTEDGYFRTGDAGRMEGNTLFFTERIKDLYKTSNGKYIAPQAIEMVMSGDQYIEQIAVIGDQRKFVSALIVPAYPLLEKYAEEKGLAVGSRKELVRNKEILRLIETHIEENQKNLASYEKIKRFTLLSEPFTMGAELTDTLKLRRSVILKKYADPIEKMYEEASNMWGSNPV